MYWMKNICFGIKNTWIWFSVSNVTEAAYWTSNIVIMHHYSRFMYILLYGLKIGHYFYIYHCLNCIWTWIIYEYTINCILNFSKYFSYCFCLILWILCSHLYLWNSVFVQFCRQDKCTDFNVCHRIIGTKVCCSKRKIPHLLQGQKSRSS